MPRAQFDAFKFYRSLCDAGVPPDQARIHAEILDGIASERVSDVPRASSIAETVNVGAQSVTKPNLFSGMLRDKLFLMTMVLNSITWCIVVWAILYKAPQ